MNGITVRAYSRAKNGAVKLSANFKVSEFACRDGTDTVLVSSDLVEVLQKLREHFGRAVVISSGYRTEAYNQKVGGATYSQHKYGTAADVTVQGVTPREVAAYAETLLASRGGVGLYRGFTHVDVRAARSRWDSTTGKERPVRGF